MSIIVADKDHEHEDLPEGIAAKARALLGSLARPYLGRVLVLALVIVVSGLATTAGPVFIARALDVGIPAATGGDWSVLVRILLLFGAASIVGALCSWFAVRLNGWISQHLLFDLRLRMFRHVQRLDIGFHEKSTSGKLVSRQTSDMESVQQFVSTSLNETLLALLQMSVIAVVLVFMNIPLALVVFAGFVPLFFVTRAAHTHQRRSYRRTRTSIAKVIVHFVETMGGIRAVQSFRRQPRGQQMLEDEDNRYRDANADALRGVARFAGLSRLIGNVTQVVILVLGGWLVVNDLAEIGVLAAFLLYLRRFYGPLDELVQSFNLYQSASAALEKIAAVLDTSSSVPAPAAPKHLPAHAGQEDPAAASGRAIDFAGTRFAYADGPDVLPRFDLHVPAGQIVALVGATGAGKSTLVKLVTRFYDPSEGAVRLDGVDLRELEDAELRASVVMVTQESFLFSGSIAENIRLGRPSATDAEVREAARAVGLDTYVEALPEGYATDVKRRGGRLSSGQRQLVSFARVFLADPDVVVLDEATAHLDIPSERLVQEALATVLEGRTAIIIAHRLSTVEIADRVLVMDAGAIVEDGEPAELVAGTGRFSQLHKAWQDSLV